MLGLDTLDAALAADPKEAAELQRTNKAIARQMLDSIRRITTDLRPSLLDDMGLVPAVAWYGERNSVHWESTCILTEMAWKAAPATRPRDCALPRCPGGDYQRHSPCECLGGYGASGTS